MPFVVVDEQIENRVEGGDFEDIHSVSATSSMDKQKVVATEPSFDPRKPSACGEYYSSKVRLCDCVYGPAPSSFVYLLAGESLDSILLF